MFRCNNHKQLSGYNILFIIAVLPFIPFEPTNWVSSCVHLICLETKKSICVEHRNQSVYSCKVFKCQLRLAAMGTDKFPLFQLLYIKVSEGNKINN